MDTEDTEESASDSPMTAQENVTVTAMNTTAAPVVADLGLTQSVAPMMGNQQIAGTSLVRQLLATTSKPVMTPMLQGLLKKPRAEGNASLQAPLGVPNTNAQQDMDVDDDESIPSAPSVLHSMDEFNSYFDQCKEALELLEMKKTILGKANCIAAYNCPKLTDEQMEALSMSDETFECLGCDDVFLFKTSLDAHVERRTALITFSCKWCKGRQDLVFYNKCNFLAHLHRHSVSASDIEDVVAQATVKPVNKVETFKIFNKITAPEKKINTNAKIPPQKKKAVASSVPDRPPQAVKVNVKTSLPQTVTSGASGTPPFDASSESDEETDADSSPEITPHRPHQPPPASEPSVKTENKPTSDLSMNPFCCFGCYKRFPYRETLANHLQEISPNGTLLQCQICKMFLGNSCKLNMHSAIHKYSNLTVENQNVPCPECGSIFKGLKALMIHENYHCMHWLRKPLFKCKFCFKYATSYSGLIKHFESNHVEIYYKCNLCQLAFRTSDSAVEHYMQVHRSKGKSFGLLHKCPFCKSVYSERKILEGHFENHFKNGDFRVEKFIYSCFMCNKPFDQAKAMRNHVISTHRKPSMSIFNCDICLVTSSDIHSLMEHRHRCATRAMGQAVTQAVKTEKLAEVGKPNVPAATSKPAQTASAPPSRKVFMCGECGARFTEDSIDALRSHMVEKHATRISEATIKEAKAASGSSSPQVSSNASSNQKKPVDSSQGKVAQQPQPIMKIKRFIDLQCAKCSHKSTDRVDFERHIATHKTDDLHSQCHQCGLCFTVEESLRKHLFIKHKIKDMATFNKLCEELVEIGEAEVKKKRQEVAEKKQEEKEKKQESQEESNGVPPKGER